MGRINKKPELVIQRSIEQALDYYKRAGVVLEYIDISALGRRYVFGVGHLNAKSDGEPDLVVWIKHAGMLHTLLIEVKNPVSFKHSANQKTFASKFDKLFNVDYVLAFSAAIVSRIIEQITHYTEQQLDQMVKDME